MSPLVAGNGGASSVGMAKLFMAPLLAHLHKTEARKNSHDFNRL